MNQDLRRKWAYIFTGDHLKTVHLDGHSDRG
jgi:hypothetical protein